MILMKKLLIVFLSAAVLISSAACHSQNGASSATASAVSSGTGSSSSGGASSAASSGTVSGPASSQAAASSAVPAFQDASRAPSDKAKTAESAAAYKVKSTDYSYKKDHNDYSVSYPQLSGLTSKQDQVNAAIKACALKTVNSLGTGVKKTKTEVITNGDITFKGKTFLSIGFNEYVTLSPKAETTHTLRTVNLDLTSGKALSFSDLVKESDSFYAVLQKEAKAQFSSEYAAKATVSAIKTGLDKNSIYFMDKGVGFAVTIQKKLLRVTLGFNEIKPYTTTSAVWKNFI